MGELGFRKRILADKDTMAFNQSGGGAIDFDESKWDTWFAKWIGRKNPNLFYAYIYDAESHAPVGEVSYRFEESSGCVEIGIIIDAAHRGAGYGRTGLRALVETAFKNGFSRLRDVIHKDNAGSHALFESIGFKRIGETEDGYDYRLGAAEYKG